VGVEKAEVPAVKWELKMNCAIIAQFSLNPIDINGFMKYNNSRR
jgi:hypothetical protein